MHATLVLICIGWIVSRDALCCLIYKSEDALQKLLVSKKQVTKDVEVSRLKIVDFKHQLTFYEDVLKNIIQQEADLSAPIGYELYFLVLLILY
jgi:hypothetical protein